MCYDQVQASAVEKITLTVAATYPMKLIGRLLLEILKASAVIFRKTGFHVIAGVSWTEERLAWVNAPFKFFAICTGQLKTF